MAAPETEGELYDRLKALVEECRELATAAGGYAASLLRFAQDDAEKALRQWLEQG